MGVRERRCEEVGTVLFLYFCRESDLVNPMSWPLSLSVALERVNTRHIPGGGVAKL